MERSVSDYAFEGPKWFSSHITWSFAAAGGEFTSAITGAYQATVRAAIDRWATVTNLTFKEVPDSTNVNIRVGFGNFTNTEIGETDYSSYKGADRDYFRTGSMVQLEDPSVRPVGTGRGDYYQGTAATLYQTVLHELGHALGLDHSSNPSALMYPLLGPSNNDLGAVDIAGIQLLYGTAPGEATISRAPITPMTVNHASASVAVFRFFDTQSGTQFLTASSAERDHVLATRPDLTYEGLGLGGIAPGSDQNAVAVYRFFDTRNGTHFFTASQSEQQSVISTRSDLVLEDTTFFEHATAQAGDVPVYRFFGQRDGTHFFTASESERSSILSTRPDLAYEGVAFYAPATT